MKFSPFIIVVVAGTTIMPSDELDRLEIAVPSDSKEFTGMTHAVLDPVNVDAALFDEEIAQGESDNEGPALLADEAIEYHALRSRTDRSGLLMIAGISAALVVAAVVGFAIRFAS